MPTAALLNIASPDCAETFFAGRAARCVRLWRVSCLDELHDVLRDRLGDPPGPVVLDLIGHSTRGHHLLRLGDTPIDMLDPFVARFFRRLDAERMMARLQVTAVRLLGCQTAVTDSGRRTIRMLGQTLGVPVYGTLKPLLKSHSTAEGFDPAFGHLLSSGGRG